MKMYMYLLLLYSVVLKASLNSEPILYGVCSQLNDNNDNPPQIVLSTENLNIDFETNYGYEISDGPIHCIWFDSNSDAESASTMNTELIETSFDNNSQNVQEYTPEHSSAIICNNHHIYIHSSNIQSKHLCSNSCHTENQQSCFTVSSSQPRNIPERYYGQSNVKPLVPSMFGISGICIAFIVVCIVIYCFGVKYSRWSEEKNGNETEKVIGDVLEEIAKYTIGDEEDEGLNDWNVYDDSDSSYSNEEILGQTILRVVSTQTIPEEPPNPSIIYSSDSDSESDEESRRQDLLVAKETLYAVSYGTNNPYSNNLAPINERKISTNGNSTPKKSPLLGGDILYQCQAASSSDASNSALP